MNDWWIVTWGEKKRDGTLDWMDLKTQVVVALPWVWFENMIDEKHERMKAFALANGRDVPQRPNTYVLINCWKMKDIG